MRKKRIESNYVRKDGSMVEEKWKEEFDEIEEKV